MDILSMLAVVISGLIAGFVGGQVGGGGLITLPVLLFLGLSAPVAIATNRFSAVFLNLAALISYQKHKKFDMKVAVPFVIIAMIGSVMGAQITLSLDALLLKKIIAFFLLALLFVISFQKELGLEENHFTISRRHFVLLMFLSFLLGIYSGFIGIVVTTFYAIIFVHYKQSFVQAMGYSLFITFFVSIVSTLVFVFHDAIFYQYAIPQAIATGVGSWYGSKFAIKKGNKWIKVFFITMVILASAKLFYEIYL